MMGRGMTSRSWVLVVSFGWGEGDDTDDDHQRYVCDYQEEEEGGPAALVVIGRWSQGCNERIQVGSRQSGTNDLKTPFYGFHLWKCFHRPRFPSVSSLTVHQRQIQRPDLDKSRVREPKPERVESTDGNDRGQVEISKAMETDSTTLKTRMRRKARDEQKAMLIMVSRRQVQPPFSHCFPVSDKKKSRETLTLEAPLKWRGRENP
ncbi:hypothetical protein NE237_019490 [Protea cynaroides]|uniref:Uncharacterized protein n=1 Tax=Protea cynaroides TaxID=273540 RepID=A0A9Q0JSS3_9MAGN|nr:hypothetical protein NE237_019490 [Protea cynaroides]